jgi:Protein of unknown function (DUF3800)
MLQAFFDDSGTHASSKAVAIGGCIARPEQWRLFEDEWAQMLARFEINEYHSSDLQGFAGEFSGWNEEKRRELITRAAKIGKMWAKNSFAGMVIREDYRDAIPEWNKSTPAFGDEYNFCFHVVIGQVMEWIQRLNPPMPDGSQASFTFDAQPGRIGTTRNTYALIKKFRDPLDTMGSLDFASSRKSLPLQFTDFIAYESYKELDRQLDNPNRHVRKPLEILISRAYPLLPRYFDRRGLEGLVIYYEHEGRPHGGASPWWPWTRGPYYSSRSQSSTS